MNSVLTFWRDLNGLFAVQVASGCQKRGNVTEEYWDMIGGIRAEEEMKCPYSMER